MTDPKLGQDVDVQVPAAAQRQGLPANVQGLLVQTEQLDGEIAWAFVRVRKPARFSQHTIVVPMTCVSATAPTQSPIRQAARTKVGTGGPRLYTHDSFDRETLAARGEALPFVPRSERQWAYALLMASFVEWVEIDAPGPPAPIRIVVRLDDQAGLVDEPLADVLRLVDGHRRPGEEWEVSTYVPRLNRR